MKSDLFGKMVREFTFLAAIANGNKLTAETIQKITVERVDINLLEIKNSKWDIDSGVLGSSKGSRIFYVIVPGEKMWVPKPVPNKATIGSMLLAFNTDAQYVVEVRNESWNGEENQTSIIIYKMEIDWRKYAKPDMF